MKYKGIVMIRIGEFSKLAKTTIKTLRFYDEIDLFKPSFVDTNGYRYYSINQLNILQKIVDFRALDIPIDKIKEILSGGDVLAVFNNRLTELKDELVKNQNNISLIKNYLAKVKKGEFMNNYQVNIIDLPKCIVYYRHGIIDSMQNLVPFILEAGEEVSKNNPNLKCAQPEYCYVTYGAKEYKEKDVEVEYAQTVENFGKESKNIKFKEVPAQKAVSIMHKGAYSKLSSAYAFALNYVAEKGFEIVAPIRESYIDGCWNKKNEEDYLTEIQIPIK